MVAGGQLGPAAQGQLLEDVGQMGLHGGFRDAEPVGDLEIAQPIDDQLHDLVLPAAEPLVEGHLPGGANDHPAGQLGHGLGDHPAGRPHLALVDDADGLDEVLHGRALGKDAPDPGLEGLDRPALVSIGPGQDDPGPHPVQAQVAADLQGPGDVRIHHEDVGRIAPQGFPDRRFLDLAHRERAIARQEAADAGSEEGAVAQEAHTDPRSGKGRGGSGRSGLDRGLPGHCWLRVTPDHMLPVGG